VDDALEVPPGPSVLEKRPPELELEEPPPPPPEEDPPDPPPLEEPPLEEDEFVAALAVLGFRST
jgi:hypothetical protein